MNEQVLINVAPENNWHLNITPLFTSSPDLQVSNTAKKRNLSEPETDKKKKEQEKKKRLKLCCLASGKRRFNDRNSTSGRKPLEQPTSFGVDNSSPVGTDIGRGSVIAF